jgi:hypothetical protein
MIAIGLRVKSNSHIFYTVIESPNPGVLNYKVVSSLLIPKALEKPEQLSFTRNTLLDIFNEYNISRAGIRIAEYTAQAATAISIDRCYLEGIIQESVASSSVEKYVAGQISTITAKLGMPRGDFKQYAEGNLIYPNLPTHLNWQTLSLEERESILVCNCALTL